MPRRLKTTLVTVAILIGCGLLAFLILVVGASEETLHQEVAVLSMSEMEGGRYWVKLAPKAEASKSLTIEAITRYPGGYAVVKVGDGASLRAKARPVAVRTARLVPGRLERTVLAFGEVAAEHDAQVAAEVGGRVVKVLVSLGGKVEANAPLVELDAEERKIALRRSEAELARVTASQGRIADQTANLKRQLEIATESLAHRKTELKRWESLSERGITGGVTRRDQERTQWHAALAEQARIQGQLVASQGAVAEAKAAVGLAAAARDQAALDLRRCTVRAPFAGRVAARMVERGDRLQPGTPVVRVVSHERVRLRVHVREAEALLLSKGAAARVTIPGVTFPATAYANGGGKPSTRPGFPASVQGVGASADSRSRKFAVDLEAKNPLELLRAGMFARVVITVGALPNALLIPDNAIVRDEAGTYVYVAQGDVAKRLPVVLGPRQGEGRVLRRGIEGAVELIVEGTGLLFDGAPIARLNK